MPPPPPLEYAKNILTMLCPCSQLPTKKRHTTWGGGEHAKLPHAFTISNYLSPVCLSGPVIAGADEMAQFSFT